MNTNGTAARIAAAASIFVLTACGGGGGSSPATSVISGASNTSGSGVTTTSSGGGTSQSGSGTSSSGGGTTSSSPPTTFGSGSTDQNDLQIFTTGSVTIPNHGTAPTVTSPDAATTGSNSTPSPSGTQPLQGSAFPLKQSVISITSSGIVPDAAANSGGATLSVVSWNASGSSQFRLSI